MKKFILFILAHSPQYMPGLLILLALVGLTCTNCNKEDDTQPKHNTFRCKVNGQDWEAYTYKNTGIFGMGVQGPTDLQYYDDTRSFSLGAIRELKDQSINQSMGISKGRDIWLGNNELPFRIKSFVNWLNPSGCRFYDLDTSKTNIINIINIDTENYTMEGTFKFTSVNDCRDTVHVTDGYFDLDYRF